MGVCGYASQVNSASTIKVYFIGCGFIRVCSVVLLLYNISCFQSGKAEF